MSDVLATRQGACPCQTRAITTGGSAPATAATTMHLGAHARALPRSIWRSRSTSSSQTTPCSSAERLSWVLTCVACTLCDLAGQMAAKSTRCSQGTAWQHNAASLHAEGSESRGLL